jgi:hypothetical protein
MLTLLMGISVVSVPTLAMDAMSSMRIFAIVFLFHATASEQIYKDGNSDYLHIVGLHDM